jgi:hypothetical protein
MSYPTQAATVIYGKSWADFNVHPALAWMEKLTNGFDDGSAKEDPWQQWVTDDFEYRKPTGETWKGEEAWEANKKDYATFTKHLHEPSFAVVWETANGWEMFGQATMYADLPGPAGDKTATDAKGNKWDVGVLAAFHFEYVKDPSAKHDGIKLRKQWAFADSLPVVVSMLKRGLITPEQMAG